MNFFLGVLLLLTGLVFFFNWNFLFGFLLIFLGVVFLILNKLDEVKEANKNKDLIPIQYEDNQKKKRGPWSKFFLVVAIFFAIIATLELIF